MSACGYCGQDVEHRPYARKRDMPSVSTIAGLYDDGKSRSFGWAASLIAATTAVHHPEDWDGLVGQQSDRAIQNGHLEECTHEKNGLCKACTYLRSEFDRQWTAKADLGSHVHHLALSWASGEEVEQDEVTEPFLDGLAQFYADCNPEFIELERTVLYDEPHSHSYRGQFDGVADLDWQGDRVRVLFDIKTGGFYPASQAMQLSAYRNAKWLTRWDDKTEVKDGPMVKVEKCAVLLLNAEGSYNLVELPANGDAFGTFLRMRDAWGWHKQMKTWEREHPLPVNSKIVEEEAAA